MSIQVQNSKQFKIIVNEIELHCITKGSGQQPLLFVPGAVVSSDWSFHEQLDYFGHRPDSGFTVIAYDPRGYGHSQLVERNFQVVPDHHLKIDAIDGYEIMKQLGYDKFYVLGWCDGGITAIYMAALFPASVEGIVIWGAHTSLTEYDLNITGVVLGKKLETHELAVQKYLITMYKSKENAERIWGKFIDSVSDLYEQTQSNGTANFCSKEMGQITCRTLILHGAKDWMCPISHAEYSNKLIKSSELQVVPEGKHRLQAAQSFNSRVEKFLKTEQ